MADTPNPLDGMLQAVAGLMHERGEADGRLRDLVMSVQTSLAEIVAMMETQQAGADNRAQEMAKVGEQFAAAIASIKIPEPRVEVRNAAPQNVIDTQPIAAALRESMLSLAEAIGRISLPQPTVDVQVQQPAAAPVAQGPAQWRIEPKRPANNPNGPAEAWIVTKL